MKAKVIRENCIGCGACQAIAPSIFEIDDEGLSKVIMEEVSESDAEDFNDALESCPTGAIVEKKD
ncbi:MAG: ferredoxin [Firmicutes bacterium]|nr:ferredoxin [Bacillota bacterium]